MVTFTPSLPATVSATTVFYTTSSRPELLTSKTQSSSVAVIPPGTFVRFVISVPLNESVSDKANLTRGILTVYENGSLDGITGNVSVNVSERKKKYFLQSTGSFLRSFPPTVLLHNIIEKQRMIPLSILARTGHYHISITFHLPPGDEFFNVRCVWMADQEAFLSLK